VRLGADLPGSFKNGFDLAGIKTGYPMLLPKKLDLPQWIQASIKSPVRGPVEHSPEELKIAVDRGPGEAAWNEFAFLVFPFSPCLQEMSPELFHDKRGDGGQGNDAFDFQESRDLIPSLFFSGG